MQRWAAAGRNRRQQQVEVGSSGQRWAAADRNRLKQVETGAGALAASLNPKPPKPQLLKTLPPPPKQESAHARSPHPQRAPRRRRRRRLGRHPPRGRGKRRLRLVALAHAPVLAVHAAAHPGAGRSPPADQLLHQGLDHVVLHAGAGSSRQGQAVAVLARQ